MNNVRVYVYDGDGNFVPTGNVENVTYDSVYSGGSASCTFTITGRQALYIRPNYRVQVRNGLTIVWDGVISGIARNPAESQAVEVKAQGYFAALLDVREWAKEWSTADVSQTAWPYFVSSSGDGLGRIRRDADRLYFQPDGGKEWATDEAIAVDFFSKDGETLKRITFDYDFQEDVQAWELELFDVTNATSEFSVTTSGTGSQDITLGTPSDRLRLSFRSKATQTPAEGIYAEVSSPVVYTETGDIDATAIAQDIAGYVTELNSTSDIADIAVDLTPFSFTRPTRLRQILAQAVGYGDASFNTYAYGVRPPNTIAKADPQLFVEAYPDTSDYDYIISLDDLNLVGGFEFSRDVSDLANYIRVVYRDADGARQVVTPDDNANLKDDDSITKWGRRDFTLRLDGTSNETNAVQNGRRFLAIKKEPQWKLDQAIRVSGYIRTKSGARLPAAEIKAGKRLRLLSTAETFNSWVFVVSRVRYNDDRQEATIEVGEPLTFDILLAQLAKGI